MAREIAGIWRVCLRGKVQHGHEMKNERARRGNMGEKRVSEPQKECPMLVSGAKGRGGFRFPSSAFTLKAHLFTSGASYLLSTEGSAPWLGEVSAKDRDEDQRNHSVWRAWHSFWVT